MNSTTMSTGRSWAAFRQEGDTPLRLLGGPWLLERPSFPIEVRYAAREQVGEYLSFRVWIGDMMKAAGKTDTVR